MRKIFYLTIMLLTAIGARAQQFVFFCVNLGDHTNGGYVADVIDGVLKQLDQQDEFVVYIRGGVNHVGKVFDAVQITKRAEWEEAKGLLDYIDRCSVLAFSEAEMLKRIFQNRYDIVEQKLTPKIPITVYWFGDEQYYLNYSRTLFLPFYFATDGANTWRNCYLYGDTQQMKDSNLLEIIGAYEYSINNVTVK